MISKKLVKDGFKKGIIKIIESPYKDGIACKIGEYWFYFCGTFSYKKDTNDYYESAEEYLKETRKTEIIDDIWTTLRTMHKEGKDDEAAETEYRYYEAFLKENV